MPGLNRQRLRESHWYKRHPNQCKDSDEIGAVHAGGIQRDGILHSRESNFPTILEGERDGLPQRELVWILRMSWARGKIQFRG